MSSPVTRYTKSGDVNIAYQVVGEGPRDLVLVPGWISNIEVFWEDPAMTHFLQRLASFSRLILFDKRGTGLSDRVPVNALPGLEARMGDVRAVMDAVKSTRATLFGYSEGGPMCALFAATHPERTTALIMVGSFARRIRAADYPWGPTHEEWERITEEYTREWGGPVGFDLRAPSAAHDPSAREWGARNLRLGASPAANRVLMRMNAEIDLRQVLPAVRVPTLIVHNDGDRSVPVEFGRYMAERIPGAKYVELSSPDHAPWVGNTDAIVDEIEEFVTGVRRGPEHDRVLATVLFSDIVDSTRHAPSWGTAAGVSGSTRTTPWSAWSWRASGAARSTPRATAFSRPSTVRPAASGPPARSARGSGSSGSTSALACTRASARSWGRSSAASPCTSAPASPPWPAAVRCWCPTRSRIWWPGPD